MLPHRSIITSVVKVALGLQPIVQVTDLSMPVNIGQEQTELRDFIRLAFVALGIDIEFSGKGLHEKGVVVDMDEDTVLSLGLDADQLRFGQTVVRCSADIDAAGTYQSIDIDLSANKTTEQIVTDLVLLILTTLKGNTAG
ncbi:hypothetical protein [Mucilaginibacter myungsuensis]|uniref:Uncharacterized protein n=1 Tax=Mucilaginibacter myungsuensis TaxID=649104 RepID=A0A929KTN6_9SPHI|nr:hypothetical protein [Mucilaginibacter myungsuensis]MBE9661344.1 hypothetical protein [Mucilaginibacter myungsuensis]MDN3597487.1 hypothetical protein [Mucilaginibacter myungsuensis]